MALRVDYGTYTGTGVGFSVALTNITGIPQVVVVVRQDDATPTNKWALKYPVGFAATASVNGWDANIGTTAITALAAGSFTVGTHTSVNTNLEDYYWFALCDQDSAGNYVNEVIEVGSYTGDGTDNRNVSFSMSGPPDVIWAQNCNAANATSIWRTVLGAAGDASGAPSDALTTVNFIQSISSSSFQVGTQLNVDTHAHAFILFKRRTGFFAHDSYVGDNNDSRNIVQADPFQPDIVLVKAEAAVGSPVLKTPSITGDAAVPLIDFSDDSTDGNSAVQANLIQAINSNGFQVGSGVGNSTWTNEGTPATTHYYMCFLNQPFAAAGGVAVGDTGFGGFALPNDPYTLFKSMLDVYKRYQNVRIQ